jgi:hypothetical protein
MPLDLAEIAAPPPRLEPISKIASLGEPLRTWVIGAPYGRYGALCNMHEALSARLRPHTRIVYLGNYLGAYSHWTGEGKALISEMIAFRNAVIAIPDFTVEDVIFLRGPLEDLAMNLTRLPFLKEPSAWSEAALQAGLETYLSAYGMPIGDLIEAANSGPVIANRYAHQWRKCLASGKGHESFLANLHIAACTENVRPTAFVPCGMDPHLPFHLQEQDELCWPEMDIADLRHYGNYGRIVRGMGVPTPKNGKDFVLTLDGHNGLDGMVHAVCLNSEGQVIESLNY